MSLVKLKNAIAKAMKAHLRTTLGRDVEIEAKKDGSRLSFHLGPVGFPVYKPEHYDFYEIDGRVGCSFKVVLMGPRPETDRAAAVLVECKAVAAKVIAEHGATGGVYVAFNTGADEEHAGELKLAWLAGRHKGKSSAELLAAADNAEGMQHA